MRYSISVLTTDSNLNRNGSPTAGSESDLRPRRAALTLKLILFPGRSPYTLTYGREYFKSAAIGRIQETSPQTAFYVEHFSGCVLEKALPDTPAVAGRSRLLNEAMARVSHAPVSRKWKGNIK